MQQDFSWVVVSNIFDVHPYLGFHDPIWRAFFSNELKQPTSFLTQFFVLFFSLIDVWSNRCPTKKLKHQQSILGDIRQENITPKINECPLTNHFNGIFHLNQPSSFTGYVRFHGVNFESPKCDFTGYVKFHQLGTTKNSKPVAVKKMVQNPTFQKSSWGKLEFLWTEIEGDWNLEAPIVLWCQLDVENWIIDGSEILNHLGTYKPCN